MHDRSLDLFAGTDAGVFLSTDNGSSWGAFSEGLSMTTINALVVVGPDSGVGVINVFAGGGNGVVWKRRLSEMITSTGITSDEIPAQCELDQNYPNPFNPSTKIAFRVPSRDGSSSLTTRSVELSVFDILGRKVATLVNEEMHPGNYEVTFDGSGLVSGVYFYRLESGAFKQTKRLVLLR